jgi:integrase
LKRIPTVLDDLPAWIQRHISALSQARREKVIEFLEDAWTRGLSQCTIANYVKAIRTLGYDGKPYEELNEEDIRHWLEALDSNGWERSTVNNVRMGVKHFLRWVHGAASPGDPTPEFLRCIKKKRIRPELPSGILSKAEVRRMIDACQNQRDRALIFVAYESGCRAGELLSLRLRDVEFDRYGAVLHVRGKTGERRIRLIESVPDLQLWISMHPSKNEAGAPLWPRTRQGKGKPLGINGFADLLNKVARYAGVEKRVHPHLFRHTRATHLARILTEAQMREFFGWSKDSKMPSVYVHLSGRDVDSTLLKHYGIRQEEAKVEDGELAPKACPRCGFVNPPSARYCQRCSACLDLTTALQLEEKRKASDEIVARIVEELIRRAPGLLDAIIKEKGLEAEIERLGNSG